MGNNITDLKKELNFMRFKKFFLLEFTKQLIRHSSSTDIFKLETILEKEKKEIIEGAKEKIKERIKSREEETLTKFREIEEGKIPERRSIVHAPIGMFESQDVRNNPFKDAFKNKNISIKNNYNPNKQVKLYIPDSKFPLHIQYIKPVPVNKDIELGKLNPLLNDPMVKIIECYGQGENVIVQGGMGTKKTGIILDKEEIDNIIQRFSRETKIPAQEGVFKVVAGRLIFLAIVSEAIGSKFIIKKMPHEQLNQGR
jgi:hypothetical protein